MNDAKWYLSGYKRCRRHAEDMLEQIAFLNAQATKVTQVLHDDVVSSTRRVDGLESTIARLIDKKDELQAKVEEMMDLQEEIEETISRVPNESQREVLFKRYILCYTYDKIAEEMECTERNVHKLHGFGLLVVQKVLENEHDRC